jgi:hypothetical protein
MTAADVIKNLMSLGVLVKDAWTKSGKDLPTFLASSDFTSIEGSIQGLVAQLTPATLRSAVDAVVQKENALLAGRSIAQLSVAELSQFHALSDVEHQLVLKLLKTAPGKPFLTTLVNDVLPVLVQVAKVVIPLL